MTILYAIASLLLLILIAIMFGRKGVGTFLGALFVTAALIIAITISYLIPV
jgi:hypothetical protein